MWEALLPFPPFDTEYCLPGAPLPISSPIKRWSLLRAPRDSKAAAVRKKGIDKRAQRDLLMFHAQDASSATFNPGLTR